MRGVEELWWGLLVGLFEHIPLNETTEIERERENGIERGISCLGHTRFSMREGILCDTYMGRDKSKNT